MSLTRPTVKIGDTVGKARVQSFCDEPNTGLTVLQESNGRRVTAPHWLLEYVADLEKRHRELRKQLDRIERAGSDRGSRERVLLDIINSQARVMDMLGAQLRAEMAIRELKVKERFESESSS